MPSFDAGQIDVDHLDAVCELDADAVALRQALIAGAAAAMRSLR